MATTTPPLLTIDQLADRLGTTVRHVRRLVADRRVPFVKVGGLVRFDPADIDAWIDDHRRTTAGPSHRRGTVAPGVAGSLIGRPSTRRAG
jgi:excisionase family DNA binding protein